MLSHISLGTNDFDRAVVFYDAVLSALGYKQVMRFEQAAAWGDQFPEFWVGPPLDDSKPAAPGNGTHVAFTAKSRAEVDAFHQAALAAGATDAGAPGPSTGPSTTVPLRSIPTATRSRPCVWRRNKRPGRASPGTRRGQLDLRIPIRDCGLEPGDAGWEWREVFFATREMAGRNTPAPAASAQGGFAEVRGTPGTSYRFRR